jgi:mannose-6-phosphate isomerase
VHKIRLLKNKIQTYAWGSHTALAELLGRPSPSPEPQAELWMGAHPKAPSAVAISGQWQPLDEWIATAPEETLGPKAHATFGGRLPYLFKVLAVARPLSIQAHPNREQARRGFRRENRLAIPMDAAHRNYKDDNHKPECICALTAFSALCGFRPVKHIIALMKPICHPALEGIVARLADGTPEQGLRTFFADLLAMPSARRTAAVAAAASKARERTASDAAYVWMLKLNEAYPSDIGALAPLFLNLIELAPGEALYVPAGELHAYLHGLGIELMANSDNVLRGGLTPKHVDLAELMQVLNFTEREIEIVCPEIRSGGEARYPTPAEEFVLSAITVASGAAYHSSGEHSIEILLCVQGRAVIATPHGGEKIDIAQGTSVVIPAAVRSYVIEGSASFYKAGVPL